MIDIYYDALDAPKKGAKVYLPNELKPDIFPHYMERDKTFNSTSILGLIYDFVKSETTEEPTPPSEITKLPCFEEELISKFQMEKCRRWYDNYRADMTLAMNTVGSDKDEIIERYKQEFHDAAGFDDSKKSLEELSQQASLYAELLFTATRLKLVFHNAGLSGGLQDRCCADYMLRKCRGNT